MHTLGQQQVADVEDAALVKSVRDGDSAAFRHLVERHEGAVAAVVCGMLGQTAEARDVGLEVFVRFFRSIDQFRGDANLKTYLTRIAINLSLNELKRRKRDVSRYLPLDDYDQIAGGPSPETELVTAERTKMVRNAIRELDTPFREVVVLRMVEGLSVRETADTLGIPAGTVLSRLARAQTKLRSLITPILENYNE